MEKGADGFVSWNSKIPSSSSSSSSSNSAAAAAKQRTAPTTTTTTYPLLSKGFINLDPPFEESVGNILNRDDDKNTVWSSSYCSTATTTTTIPLQPFDMFSPAYSTKSPVGFPFTPAQWGELERQAMIYKYIMCCVPVPTDLLFPLTLTPRNSYAAAAGVGGSALYNVRFARNGDPEPGRCKRTDGKKWRCAREVAPHQKYCERHLHRGRPRSRKPVEVKNGTTTVNVGAAGGGESSNTHKRTRLHPVSLPTPKPASSSHPVSATVNDSPLLLFNSKTDVNISNRDLGLIMEADEQHHLQLLVGPNIGFTDEGSSSIHGTTTLFDQNYLDQHHHHALNVFTVPEIQAQAGFIDAWSIDSNNIKTTNNGNTEATNQGSLTPYLNLSMAMAVGNPLDEGLGKIQLDPYEDHSTKNWLGHHVSWQPFAQGGPLAEALYLGSVYANPVPASPHDSIGTPVTTVSSPSGVLQRTFFSHSDSSVCNSPTFAAAHVSEVALPWFNHND